MVLLSQPHSMEGDGMGQRRVDVGWLDGGLDEIRGTCHILGSGNFLVALHLVWAA